MNNKRRSLWVKLACDYFDDERVLQVGPEAELLFVRGLAWAKRENDGRVGRGALVRLGMGLQAPVDCAVRLASVGLWVEVPDGYQIANWHDWQVTGEQTGKRAEAGGYGNHQRWHKTDPSPDCRWCVADGSQPGRKPVASAIPELEVEKDNTLSRTATSVGDLFNAWWQVWPKKVARGQAAKAYAKALKTATADVLLQGAERVAHEWATLEPDRRQFVPYPATWLNAERWLDNTTTEPAPVVRPAWVADADCPDCGGDGWRTVDEVANTLAPCGCRRQP